METFETVDDVELAYEKVLKLQRDLNGAAKSEEIDWDDLSRTIEEQTAIMNSIEKASQLDEAFREKRSERFRTLMEEIESLREKLAEEINERKDEVEQELDSLDQSATLLDEYQQETGSSYHLDQTI